jgi:hypothetical protein
LHGQTITHQLCFSQPASSDLRQRRTPLRAAASAIFYLLMPLTIVHLGAVAPA